MPDLNAADIDSAMRMIAGTARRWAWRSSTDAHPGQEVPARPPRCDRRPANIRSRQAIELVKGAAFAKFDETVEVAVRLGVDPRHADQVVRGTVVLPARHR